MKTSPITQTISACLLGAVLFVAAGTAQAATKPVQDKISYTEAWADKIVCTREDGDVWCDTTSSDSITISATISLAGVDTKQFNQDTLFSLTLGEFEIEHSLGDDTKFTTSKKTPTSATFKDTGEDDNGKTILLDTVKLSWTTKQLTVTITAKTLPITADNYDGNDSGAVNDTLTGSIDFGDVSVSFDSVTVTGKVTTKNVTKSGDDYTLSTISLKGSGLGTR